MKILVPITHSYEMDILNPQQYNTEFFCGYLPEWWTERFNHNDSDSTLSVPLNNRNDKKANVSSRDELATIIKKAKAYHTDVFLALNAKYYPNYAFDSIGTYLDEVVSLGITRMIVCDIGMIQYLRTNYPQIKVSVSCLNQATNTKAVEFYQSFGNVDRVVFPRHMSSDEIERIALNVTNLSFEYFIFSNKCLFDDGYCRGIHAFTPVCKDLFYADFYSRNNSVINAKERTRLEIAEYIFARWTRNELLCQEKNICTPNFACSACSLLKLNKITNIESVKISIRGHNVDELLRQVIMADRVITLVKNGADHSDIKETVAKLYGKETLCSEGTSCMMI